MRKREIESFIAALLVTALCTTAVAQTPESSATVQLASIADHMGPAGSPDERRQILDALAASPILLRQVGKLVTDGALTTIDIGETPASADPLTGPFVAGPAHGPFAASIVGSRIVLSSSLLVELRKARLYDVARPEDVLPNQTLFVLAHLASLLAQPPVLAVGQSMTLEAYVTRQLHRQAQAYIDAWNATVDGARRNDEATLTNEQIASLMLNCRYRFAFLGVRRENIRGPMLLPSGSIDATPANLNAIAQTLERSPVADLE